VVDESYHSKDRKQQVTMTTLTDEQRERIRRNRERAFQIQKERKLKQEQEEQTKKRKEQEQQQQQEETPTSSKKLKSNSGNEEDRLEPFEEGASEYVTKTEAMSVYCLPEGTLAVCEDCIEKENPRNKSWKPMKLYRRSEVRQRARARYGGMEGLIRERTKRRERKLAKDMKGASDIFKK